MPGHNSHAYEEVSAIYGHLAGILRLVQPAVRPVTDGPILAPVRAGDDLTRPRRTLVIHANRRGGYRLVGGAPHVHETKPGETIDIRPLNADFDLVSQERANAT